MREVRDVDVEEAAALAESGAVMLDVREHSEWEAGHMSVARHLPLDEVGTADLSDLTDQQVVAICRSGNRSSKAAQILAESGVDVVNLAGGMNSWAASGRAVVTDLGEPGEVV